MYWLGEKVGLINCHYKTVLDCFTNAAVTTLALFDLSELPPGFDYIKESGDLFLFAKDLH